jgi:hypothetical protein
VSVSDLDVLLQNCLQDEVEGNCLSTRTVMSVVVMVLALLISWM